MKKIEIISDEIVRGHIAQELVIEIGGDEEIAFIKSADWGDEGDDVDWMFASGDDEKKFKALNEDTQDRVKELVDDYVMKL